MSMPSFPDIDPEMTCDRALNMILASIAMEELALSHIINAEGEKLQYVLKKLETSCGGIHDVDKILTVNQSVTCLLDSVLQNQMILKNKMDKALHALLEVYPKPPLPPIPPCPPSSCKCSAVFKAAEKCKQWCDGSALRWNAEHIYGKCIYVDPCDKTKIELRSKGRFMISFSINVRGKGCNRYAAASLQMIKKHHCKDIYTVRIQIPCDGNEVTISMSNTIIENCDNASSILLKLESPYSLSVEDSILSIIEI